MWNRIRTALLNKPLDAFAARYDYDVDYLREIGRIDTAALLGFSRINGMSNYRKDIPAEAYFAAKIRAILNDDCGPCTQLAVNMAREANVPDATIRAILSRDLDALSPSVARVLRFTEATLAHDVAADALRTEIVAQWGERALVSIAFAIATARVYPALKYAMGHGHACTRVSVGSADLVPQRSPDTATDSAPDSAPDTTRATHAAGAYA